MKEDKYRDLEKLQDAIGDVREDFVAEAALDNAEAAIEAPAQEESKAEPTYNSWTQMAMNTERQKKLKKGSVMSSSTAQKITILVASLFIVSIFILPKVAPGLFFKESAVGPGDYAATEESAAAPDSAAPGSAISSDSSEASYSGSSESAEKEESAEGSDTTSFDIEEDDISVEPPINQQIGEAFRLTAAEWRDNDNWPFFTNLVNSGTISFPSYGLDPRNRIKVTVTENGIPVQGQRVELIGSSPQDSGTTLTNKDGICYFFYRDGANLEYIAAGGEEFPIEVIGTDNSGQGNTGAGYLVSDMEIDIVSDDNLIEGTQVMFIVDTTGSMADELAYLQKDFASIAEETFDGNTEFSVNFYRDEGDEYVTKTNGFTKNLATIQNQLNAEYAAGGGDTPEAVSDILMETIVDNDEWNTSANKVAFLIFDAPPHEGTEQQIMGVVHTAAELGIHIVPVVASNAERDTEIFGRALAIMTDGTYVFLTDDSGIGNSHLEPIVGDYEVELLHDIIVRIINSYK